MDRPEKCFEASMEAASENENGTVVHAWIPATLGWKVYAWVETDDVVLDYAETRSPMARAEYYEIRGVTEQRLKRYTRVEFFTLMADTGSLGPFDKEFFPSLSSTTDPLQAS